MKFILCRIIVCLAVLPLGFVQALGQRLEVVPSTQTAPSGGAVSVDVSVSGLGSAAAPSLGAFDLALCFDPTVLSFRSVRFGALLGDEAASEAVTGVSPFNSHLDAFEVSLLLPAELIAIQPASFTLFTATFAATSAGTSPMELALNAPLSDENGDPLSAILADGDVAVVQLVPMLSPWGAAILCSALMGIAILRLGRFAAR